MTVFVSVTFDCSGELLCEVLVILRVSPRDSELFVRARHASSNGDKKSPPLRQVVIFNRHFIWNSIIFLSLEPLIFHLIIIKFSQSIIINILY